MALNFFGKKKKNSTSSGQQAPQEKSAEGAKAVLDQTEEARPMAAEITGGAASAPTDLQASADRCDRGEPRPPKAGLFSRLKKGLSRTRRILTTDIDALFGGKSCIDEDMLDELEELLITSDIGVQTAMALMQTITQRAAKIKTAQELKEALKKEILAQLRQIPAAPTAATTKPHVVMVVGVNGVGKTTTIGKLAAKATQRGEAALIVAADTFRAAAIEQLGIWAERAGADMVKHKANADPAAVAYDGMEAALARKIDTVFVDTAGRLHTKVNLMEELKKIKRTISKIIPAAPHEILLVLDATTGQNALSQAKLFHEALGVSGLALTKLDGTAKGGIVISICRSLNIPLQYIGIGEGIEDLQVFNPEQFADALF
jgi:fused signal recognition particle receptor